MKRAIAKMRAAGIALRADDGELVVTYDTEPTAEQWAWIKAHKAELIAELRPVVGGPDDPVALYRPGDPCPDPMRLSVDSAKAIERVTRKLVSEALAYYRDDGDSFETMSDAGIETAVVVFIARELYVQRMLGIHGATAPPTEESTA